jgi:hypothetical protein
MARTFLAALLLTTFGGLVISSGPPPTYPLAAVEPEPDTSRARPLDNWPSAADLERLRSVEGKPKAVVLQVLGHPARVERRAGGEEVWEYPWSAVCRVWIRDGVCTGTFYTGGY